MYIQAIFSIVDLRKLERKYYGPKKNLKRDVIQEHLNYDSHLYAPLTRNGPNPDMLSKAPTYTFDLHHNFEGKNLRFRIAPYACVLKQGRQGDCNTRLNIDLCTICRIDGSHEK